MKYYLLLLYIILSSCKSNDSREQIKNIDSVQRLDSSNISIDTIVNTDEYMATYYLVIIDTNSNYFSLDAKMYQLHKRLDYPIDTGGNYYNIKKDEIMLPENDEDEIYAGTYYHRRYPSQFLSLEYLDSYDGNNSKPKTICLLAGIYETKLSADSACEKLRLIEPKTYVQKSSIYIGCIH